MESIRIKDLLGTKDCSMLTMMNAVQFDASVELFDGKPPYNPDEFVDSLVVLGGCGIVVAVKVEGFKDLLNNKGKFTVVMAEDYCSLLLIICNDQSR